MIRKLQSRSKKLATPVKYKDAVAAAGKLRHSSDPELSRAAKVVSDYLGSRPTAIEEFLETRSEGFQLRRVFLELRAIVSREQVFDLRRPFKVQILREENYFLVFSPSYLVHATGDTIDEAFGNYMDEFIAHFEWLIAYETELAPPLKKELAKLRRQLTQPG